jgi:hypothetical protein
MGKGGLVAGAVIPGFGPGLNFRSDGQASFLFAMP